MDRRRESVVASFSSSASGLLYLHPEVEMTFKIFNTTMFQQMLHIPMIKLMSTLFLVELLTLYEFFSYKVIRTH